MGLNASAAFNLLNFNNNGQYKTSDSNGNSSNHSFEQQNFQTLAQSVKNGDDTYNMPSGSIYDTAGSVAYNYYNTSFSTDSQSIDTAGSIASSVETAGSIASSSSETAGSIASSSSGASVSSGGSSPSGGATTAGSIA